MGGRGGDGEAGEVSLTEIGHLMLKCTLDSPVIARGPRAGLIIGGGEGSPAQPSVTTKAGVTQVLGHPESTSKSSASCLSFQVPSQFSIGDPTFSLDS